MAYNRIFNDDEWNTVNVKNKEIMDDYLMEYKARKKKQTTIDQYKNDIRIVLIYILKKCSNKCILDMSKKEFRNISLWFSEELGLSNARTNRLMSSCRSLLSYCEDEDEYEYDSNAAKKVKGLSKEVVRDIMFLTNEEIIKMKEYLVNKEEYQKALLLMLLYDSGGRKNEIAQVEKHSFLDKSRNSTNKVVGKRGKVFPLLYFSGTKECCEKWLGLRGEDNIDSLFIVGHGESKKSASGDNLYDWIVSLRVIYERMFGKPCDFNVHSLRHSCLENFSTGEHYVCKELGIDGFPVEKLRLIANHSDISTTQSYLKDKSSEELENMFKIKI